MHWLEGMQRDSYDWDVLCVQEVAMRNQEDNWRYDMQSYGDMQFWWKDRAMGHGHHYR